MEALVRVGQAGLTYSGIIGTNAFSGTPVGMAVADMTWDKMCNLLLPGRSEEGTEDAA